MNKNEEPYYIEAQGKERCKYYETETKEEKGSRLWCLLLGANLVIPRRLYHFEERIVNPIYKRREQDRMKDVKIDSLNELD